MTGHFLQYPLTQGFIHHWLVAGSQATELNDFEPQGDQQIAQQISQAHFAPDLEISQQPKHLDSFTINQTHLEWQYYRCLPDHFIHQSSPSPGPEATFQYIRRWAACQLYCFDTLTSQIHLTTNGSVSIWLNQQILHRHQGLGLPDTQTISIPVTLQAGDNHLYIRFDQIALGRQPHRLAAQVSPLPNGNDQIHIRLLTPIKEGQRFQAFETMFEQAIVDRDIYMGSDVIAVAWPGDLSAAQPLVMRLQHPSGRIYAETYSNPKPDGTTKTIIANSLTSGSYQAVLMPQPREFSEQRMRVRRVMKLLVLRDQPVWTSAKPYLDRLSSGVQQAMQQRQGLLSEIAVMTLGAWNYLNAEVIQQAIDSLHPFNPDYQKQVLGCLHILEFYGTHASFPMALKAAIETCLQSFLLEMNPTIKFKADDPRAESQQILTLTAQLLTSQYYVRHPDLAAEIKRETQDHIQADMIDWLYQRGQYGLHALCFDDEALDEIIFALSQLVALTETDLIRELSAILLDKIGFALAITSFRGIGCGGVLGTTANFAHLMWGMGVFNRHLWGVVGLANSGYEMPSILSDIALDSTKSTKTEQWFNECQTTPNDDWAIKRVTYRTSDYLLTSWQDYRPGQRGTRETVWQAILDPVARVFVNHPAHFGQEPTDVPNFWQGNQSLPKVVQWKQTLIAIYKLPDDDWLGFTHAYFPQYAFDESCLHNNWAFARQGQGYLALTASTPLTFITDGLGAGRELRASGLNTIWLCQMGRAKEDGSFDNFQQKVLSMDMTFTDTAVAWTTLQGQRLSLGWHDPFQVNDIVQTTVDPKHYDTPYGAVDFPAEVIDIHQGEYRLTLDFRR